MKNTLLALIGGTLFALNAFAIDEGASKTFPDPQPAGDAKALHAGVIVGYVDPEATLKGTVGYGLDFGYQPYIPFGLGLQALYYKSGADIIGGTAGIKRTEVLARFTYNFGGENMFLSHSYFGLKVGAVFTTPYVDLGTTVDGSNYTRLGIAPVVGFDLPVYHDWTAGLDATYLFVFGPESIDSFQLLAAVKYWF